MAGVLVLCLIAFSSTFALIIGGLYIYAKIVYGYFKKRRIPFDIPIFPFGSLTSSAHLKKSFSCVLADMYTKYKGIKMVGFFSFWQKDMLITDPEMIKQVLIKDFDVFQDRGVYYNKQKDPLSAHLFALAGEEWKTLRIKLIPTFSSGKIKGMFHLFDRCASEMTDYVAMLKSENPSVDCQKLFFSYGLAVISNTAFGLESDALTNKDSTFVKMAKKMVAPTIGRMLSTILMFHSEIAKILNTRVVPSDVSDFFMCVVKDAIRYREKNSVNRNDYLQLLIQLKDDTSTNIQGSDVRLSDNELAAEAFVFILAGSETTSSTMSFCLYELAMNAEVQTRLQDEVDSLQEITYESINGLEYLSMVVDETLRKYPPLGFLNRLCSRDYPVPGTDITIEKGVQVFVSIRGLHNDPELFPEPERFIPERFSRENKANIRPYTYMPFGEGPRFCIGMRFAKMSVKTGLAVLLRQYRVLPTSSTPKQVKFEPRTIATTAAGGVWLSLRERRQMK
uniref:Cytochrome P450 n=1 Tax=Graphocephala atropunctata TaxID=36148 RepID=A0A1B6LYY8_9HEMI